MPHVADQITTTAQSCLHDHEQKQAITGHRYSTSPKQAPPPRKQEQRPSPVVPCRNVVAHGIDRHRCRQPRFRPSRGPPPPVSPENEFPHHPLCFPQLTMISCARECQQRKASAATTSASSASTFPPEGTTAARRRSLSPFQEVPSSSSPHPEISPRHRSSPRCPR